LQHLHASNPLHRPFSSSKRLMRILRAIVEPTTDLLAIGVADLFHRHGIRAKPEGVAHGLKLPQPNTARKFTLTLPQAGSYQGLPSTDGKKHLPALRAALAKQGQQPPSDEALVQIAEAA